MECEFYDMPVYAASANKLKKLYTLSSISILRQLLHILIVQLALFIKQSNGNSNSVNRGFLACFLF